LQDELKILGFLANDIDSTGYYGDLTLEAVDKYRESNNSIISSSVIDQLITSTKYKERSDNVVKLQDELKILGFLANDIDSTGYYGDLTLEAVKKYENSNNSIVDTSINMQSLSSMSREQLINILINLINLHSNK
jgi:peptidoglycan hydrolase-like protein with peptidoglycan-binding domain